MNAIMMIGLLCLAPPQQEDPIRAIFGEVNSRGQAYPMLRHMCDEIGGRLSTFESGRRAEAYAHARFKAWGLDARFEPFEMLGWRNDALTVTVTVPFTREVYAVALGATPSGDVTAEVADMGFGTPGEFEKNGAAAKGKIAMVMNGAPSGHRGVHRSEKLTLSARAGARAMILINSTAGNVPQAGTCSIGSMAPIPAISITREEGLRLRRLITSGKDVTMTIRTESTYGRRTARNVIGEIRGTERPEEVVLIGAHLDSWQTGTGAIDNGTGSSVVLECARLFSTLKLKPRRTVRFVLFMGEEQGLYGSKAYVKAHAGELKNILFMMNLDMVGKPSGFRLSGADEAVPFFKRLAGRLKFAGMTDAVPSRMGLHSDHQPFMIAGVPTGGLSSKLDDEQGRYYHSAGDTFDKAKREYLNECAAVASVALLEIADAAKRPAPHLTPAQVKARLERDGQREALELEGQWPFK